MFHGKITTAKYTSKAFFRKICFHLTQFMDNSVCSHNFLAITIESDTK